MYNENTVIQTPMALTAYASVPSLTPDPVLTQHKEEAAPTKVSKHREQGITSLSELQSLEVLRTEFASGTFKPKVILSYETISFNKACINLMPDARFVNVLVDRHKKRIIILPVNKHAKYSSRFKLLF